MKKWICYNLFGNGPDNVGMIGMLSGLGIIGFLVGGYIYFFIYIPFFAVK